MLAEALLPGLVETWKKAARDIERQARPLLDKAVQQRLLREPVLDIFGALLPVQRDLLTDQLRRYLEREDLPFVIEALANQDSKFALQAAEVTQTAALEGWTEAQYERAIRAVASDFGAEGLAGRYAQVWWQTFVVTVAYHRAQDKMLATTPAGNLFPLLELRTQRDGRVRPSHAQAERFVGARPLDWPGWAIYTPPVFGSWGCRCFRRMVSWVEARSRGLL